MNSCTYTALQLSWIFIICISIFICVFRCDSFRLEIAIASPSFASLLFVFWVISKRDGDVVSRICAYLAATSALYTYLVLYSYMSLYLYLGMDPIEKEKLVPEFLHTQCSCLGSLTPPACPVLKACQGTVVKYQHLAGRTAHFTYFHWCF